MTKKYVFVVLSHLEIESDNYSTEVVKVFDSFEKAREFAKKLESQAESNENIDIEELALE
jgi:hypothetical protein